MPNKEAPHKIQLERSNQEGCDGHDMWHYGGGEVHTVLVDRIILKMDLKETGLESMD